MIRALWLKWRCLRGDCLECGNRWQKHLAGGECENPPQYETGCTRYISYRTWLRAHRA